MSVRDDECSIEDETDEDTVVWKESECDVELVLGIDTPEGV
jgi:hypothetical protein